jgi:hypothetical protein
LIGSRADAAGQKAVPATPSLVESKWKTFTKQSFRLELRNAFVVVPQTPATGKPWIWRTSFPNYHPEVDIELLKQGFHIAYLDVVAMLGADEALDRMDRFYGLVREHWDLSEKPALEPIAKARIPLRHVISPNDKIVPAEENTLEAKRRLQALGWGMDVVTVDPDVTKNGGHHFPLPEIGQSVRFIRKHTMGKASNSN